jgi:hypothetical protein
MRNELPEERSQNTGGQGSNYETEFITINEVQVEIRKAVGE